MFALVPPLVARLQTIPALDGWEVRDADAEVPRTAVPAAVVDYEAIRRGDRKPGSVVAASSLSVRLIAENTPDGRNALDAAFVAVIGSVENWKDLPLAGATGRFAFEFTAVEGPDRNDQGQVGYRLVFETPARFSGQP